MIVLDTHSLVWWINTPAQLSARAAAEIESADQIAFSAISCWEVAMLVRRGRITLDDDLDDWWDDVSALAGVTMLPITPDIGIAAAELTNTLRDPADCLIVATSLNYSSQLVTKDRRIRTAQIVETIW